MLKLHEAKVRAKEQAKSSFLILCAASFIPTVIASVVTTITAGVGSIVAYLGLPVLNVGIALIFLNTAYGEPTEFTQIFAYYKQWWTAFCAYFLMQLYIFLWSLLFVVPGIIAALRYSMAYYILAENPNLSATEALNLSKEMTRGHLWDIFMLHLSFIGWYLLSAITCGIALFWVAPYVNAAQANAFLILKKEYLS